LVISATLEFILADIRDRGRPTEGITVHRNVQRGASCSEVSMDLYGGSII